MHVTVFSLIYLAYAAQSRNFSKKICTAHTNIYPALKL